MPTTTNKYRTQYKQLRALVSTWRTTWRDIAENVAPNKGRYLTDSEEDKQNTGKKKTQKIINGTAKDGIGILAAGMQGGLTSPSRPWFVLTIPDEQLLETDPVRLWLHDVRNRILVALAQSNFYDAVHGSYEELATFGTTAMLIEEDFETIVRFRPFTIGEFLIALDSKYRPDTLYRIFALTARQLEQEFGRENLSAEVINALDTDQAETLFDVIHCIRPNADQRTDRADERGMAFESVYFLVKGDEDQFLRRGGYRERPFVAPRWSFSGTDVYGECPTTDSLGDIKMLQKMETDKLKKLKKHVDPAMVAPTSLKGKGGNILPGGITYTDVTQGQQGFRPAYELDSDIRAISEEIRNVEERIRRKYFNDLFLSIINSTKRMTTVEIGEITQEKMLILGPVLEKLITEFLEPTIIRVFNIMLDLDLLPPVPLELQGQSLKIEFISALAQAQKASGINPIERVASFVGSIAPVFPDVVDKFDADEAVGQYAGLLGAPPRIIRSDDLVAVLRQQRANQAAMAQMNEQLATGAQTAKTLSETESEGSTALETAKGAIAQFTQ